MRLFRDWVQNKHVILAEEALDEIKTFFKIANSWDLPDEFVLEGVQGIYEKVRSEWGSLL